MPQRSRPSRCSQVSGSALLVLASLALAPRDAGAQSPDDRLRILRLESTPIGALPPMALPMPASRDHNYWGGHLQAGQRRGRDGRSLRAAAAGIDLQWRGGSIFGITGGVQTRDCDAGTGCGEHALVGARGRFNVLTGGPTVIGALLGDPSTTGTLGAELGLGAARNVTPGDHACTLDLGMPVSIAMLQRMRFVGFVTPGAVWDLGCYSDDAPSRPHYLVSYGVGVQQLGARGLDLYIGAQRIFRSGTGHHFGISITYIRLP
jgi:hypothetical protein